MCAGLYGHPVLYVQVPIGYISSLILIFFKHFVCLGFLIVFWFFSRYILGFPFITEWQH